MNWTATRPIRVVVLDDHAVVRHGLAARLKQEADIEVSGMFASGREVVQALKDNTVEVDILLMDYSLGPAEIDGLNLIRLIRVRYPELKILVASAHHNKATVGLVMHAGARGFVGKEEELSELVRAIRTVAAGGKRLNATLAAEMERDALAADAPAPTSAGDGNPCRSSWWMWTTSSATTTPSATSRAMPAWRPWPQRCPASCAAPEISSRATAAKSLSSCCPTPARTMHRHWPSARVTR